MLSLGFAPRHAALTDLACKLFLAYFNQDVNQALVVGLAQTFMQILRNHLGIIQLLVGKGTHELEELTVGNLHCAER